MVDKRSYVVAFKMFIPIRNLFRKDEIPRGWLPDSTQDDRTTGMTEPVIVVHGTFAGRVPNSPALPRKWWERGGSFCERLDGHLRSHGSNARCWSHIVDDQFEYSWSGKNEETARQTASKSLGTYLQTLEQDTKISRFHIVAHSHGGNVVFEAVAGCGTQLKKLSKVVCLGTPFISRRSQINKKLYRILHWLSIFVFLCLCLFMSFLGATLLLDESSRETARLYGDPVTQAVVQMDFSQLMGIVLAVVFVSLPFAAKRPHSRKVIESLQGKLYTVSFSADEALLLLTHAANLRKNLGSLKKFLPKPRWNSYLAQSIPGFWELFISAPLYLLFLYSLSFNLLSLGLIPMFGDSVLYAYGAAIRKVLNVDLAEHRFFWGQYRRGRWEHKVLKAFSLVTCWLVVVSLYFIPPLLVVLAIDFVVLGFLVFVGSCITSYASRRGIKSLCNAALGNDVLGDPILAISLEPPGFRTKRVNIDQKIEVEAKSQASQYAALGVQRFYDAYDSLQPHFLQQITLLESILNAFRDPELLHNQYYSIDGIIEQVAKVIACE